MKASILNQIGVATLAPNPVISRNIVTKQSRVAHATLDCRASLAMTMGVGVW
jgi:hypothetical protein